ncbi:MAG: c-type cytochrome [Bacteroidota bacterium]|nr:c-type cytochrome [Bacteroidota bacterium]
MHLFQKHLLKLFTLFLCLSVFAISCKQSASEKKKENEDPKIAKLKLPEGFHAEHLYSPGENDQGSWVAMTFDNKGRMIASDQYGYLYRITIPPVGYDTTKQKVIVEKLDIKMPGDTSKAKVKMGLAHGLLYAFNSLYVTVNDEGEADSLTRPSGLYRVQDTNGDDQYDKITLLKRFEGQGEHGPHNAVLSPDKQSIYVIAGNFTDLPKMDNYRLPETWKVDNLFPLLLDPNGFGNDREPPGGWIIKTDSAGTKWELISSGYRNPFDMAFNDDGELFTFDSDMEWDMGLPWYRPIRVNHVTSGSDYGYRENNEKWSPAYPDNLPAVINIGQGSPTNVMSGMNARFPENYRRGLFTFDWSYGIIYHFDLIPQGSSYTAKAEEFISGSPLPLTDGAIGPDGAMYFLTGGRRIESDLYRIYYGENTLKNDPLPPANESNEVIQARKIRKQLEAFQEKPDPTAIATAWPYLKDNDRFIRYAARIAVEHQPVGEWQSKALAEKDPVTLTQAMIALARNGSTAAKDGIINALLGVNYDALSQSQQIDFLRAVELTLSRMGKPNATQNEKLIAYLEPKYPANNNELNRSLSKILVFIGDTQAAAKTLALMDVSKDDTSYQRTATQSSDLILRNQQYGLDVANMLAHQPPAQQIYLATVLSSDKVGWTPEMREKYFKYFYNFLERKGGNSYTGYINSARKKALANAPKEKFAYYDSISGISLLNGSGIHLAEDSVRAKGPGRAWTVAEATPLVENLSGRDFNHGRAMFKASMCIACHTMGQEGGSVGPDLTQLGTRFSGKDMLESIIEPSKAISDQYAETKFTLKNGSTVSGRLIRDDKDKYYVSQNPFAPQMLREIAKSDVVSTKLSDVSIMMPGLINGLNPEELKDLIAYLKSGGDKNNKIFKADSK